jgi:hypothetical protein
MYVFRIFAANIDNTQISHRINEVKIIAMYNCVRSSTNQAVLPVLHYIKLRSIWRLPRQNIVEQTGQRKFITTMNHWM